MRKLIATILFLVLGFGSVFSQLTQGGIPLEITGLKSIKARKYVELTIPKSAKTNEEFTDPMESQLKPFQFAYAIPVSLNAYNSGDWYQVENYNIWQLALYSAEAKSLNLIFDKFHLPEGARLFIFSEDRSDLLGAFTSENNKPDKVFATSPVIGDRIIIQYEEPVDALFSGELSLKSVNHDFIGIKSDGDERRPLGESGACNVNVNCDYLEDYRLAANSVCRILIGGTELCTGTLVNNTSNDETPYVYTAAHCINRAVEASESVFLFNYESPYCGSIDGEVNQSLSGSTLRAFSDSLDFSLVEIGVKPPKSFRPYYLGWSYATSLPDSSVSIHHPSGDIKKITIDRDSPSIKSYSSSYISNAFFQIGNWEEGTTEGGSSGAPLIDQDMLLVGALTGGAATCEVPVNDYYSRFAMAWDYYSSASKQLKAWLDPISTDALSIGGMTPFIGADLCGAFTNFTDDDVHENLLIEPQDETKGYWGGTNDYGFISFAEQFTFDSESELSGVSLGVSKAYVQNQFTGSTIRIDVYAGETSPEGLLYSQNYDLKDIDEGVMNYFGFDEPVAASGDFFIAYSIDNVQPADTFAVFIATRLDTYNSFFIKDGEEWYSYPDKSGMTEGSSILMEAILCNIDTASSNTEIIDTSFVAKVYPNPLRSGQKLMVEFDRQVFPNNIQVFDLMGRQVDCAYSQMDDTFITFDFSGKRPGIYIISIEDPIQSHSFRFRVSYLGG